MSNPIHLGVNIDHVATIRQARGTDYPRPADAVPIVEAAGADSITVHLREDRRHIQDHDLDEIAAVMKTHMNLEMAVTSGMISIALGLKPPEASRRVAAIDSDGLPPEEIVRIALKTMAG